MTKAERLKIFQKYNAHCAYCGCVLTDKFQVDHIVPIYHNDTDETFEKRVTNGSRREEIPRGTNAFQNYNPACARCNKWKSTMSIETFRQEIGEQVKRARRDSCNFRMAEDFGLITKNQNEVVFYFEKHEPNS